MSETVNIEFSGPLFNGVAEQAMRKMSDEVQRTVATYAEDTWQSYMDASFKHPTGAYQSHVNIARRDKDLVVNDGWPASRLQYGPWLEGIGSRNSPVTRFPGYHALRRAREHTERDVPQIAAPIVDRHVREANA